MNDQYRGGSDPFGRTEDNRGAGGRSSDDLGEAVKRFEKAVEGLAMSARDQFGDRAARFINEATSRIEREAGRQSRRQERRERRRHRRGNVPAMWLEEPASEADEMETAAQRGRSSRRDYRGRWYRDRQRRKIAGVCSGLARYFGVQTWVVRGATITGALFFPALVIPAYFIAMVVLPETPRDDLEAAAPLRSSTSTSRPSSSGEEPPRSVRRDFRDTQALLSQAELRLRRMEAHVTSDQYELQKELHRLEHGGSHGGSVA